MKSISGCQPAFFFINITQNYVTQETLLQIIVVIKNQHNVNQIPREKIHNFFCLRFQVPLLSISLLTFEPFSLSSNEWAIDVLVLKVDWWLNFELLGCSPFVGSCFSFCSLSKGFEVNESVFGKLWLHFYLPSKSNTHQCHYSLLTPYSKINVNIFIDWDCYTRMLFDIACNCEILLPNWYWCSKMMVLLTTDVDFLLHLQNGEISFASTDNKVISAQNFIVFMFSKYFRDLSIWI